MSKLYWPGYASTGALLSQLAQSKEFPLSTMLAGRFMWHRSPQGHKFWADIFENLLDHEEGRA